MSGPDRRRFLQRALALGGAAAAAACDRLDHNASFRTLLGVADAPTERAFELLTPDDALAEEFTEADLSPAFRANGSTDPKSPEYRAWVAAGFADWRLRVGGLVANPMALSLVELRALPARTQITRHDCVEGWSCIGKWTGAKLGALLERARPLAGARFVVFRCADSVYENGVPYYESIHLREAWHPQTILAYDMNDAPLAVPHGAPLRLRVERKLGYKQAKYLTGIDLVADLSGIGQGRGGYWEDFQGYQWHGGI